MAFNIHRVCLRHPETIQTLRPHVTPAQGLISSKIVLKSNSNLLGELILLFDLKFFSISWNGHCAADLDLDALLPHVFLDTPLARGWNYLEISSNHGLEGSHSHGHVNS